MIAPQRRKWVRVRAQQNVIEVSALGHSADVRKELELPGNGRR